MEKFMKKFIAFTLSEILIAIGIIGVIGTLTIPNIAKTYERRALLAKAKSTFKDLSIAFQGIDEVLYRAQREKTSSQSLPYKTLLLLGEDKLSFMSGPSATQEYFYSGEIKYYNGSSTTPNLNGDASGVLQGNIDIDLYIPSSGVAGSDISSGPYAGSKYRGYLYFDINGKSNGPNMRNVDIFVARIVDDGLILSEEQDNQGSFDDFDAFK
ncbi:MAG: hypothetical protein ACI37S_07975 [Candidatus Gastranaerophilaceae bacterium]